MKNLLKKIRYLLEALIVWLALLFFRFLGPKNASNFAAFLAKTVGKRHSTNKLAFDNISKALPNLSRARKLEIVEDMWDNLGRIVGEYVHISRETGQNLLKKYVILDEETLQNIDFIKNNKEKGGLIFSAHIGNWEIGPKILANLGFNVSTVYRPLNNPYVEKMTAQIRDTKLIAKSSKGSREIIAAIKNGQYVVILADQKTSEGELVKFFHDDAITTTSLARIALKYDVPLIAARSIRINKEFKFEIKIEKPLEFKKSDDLNKDILDLTRMINKKLEDWIKEFPHQWFWVHNRWKK